MYWLQPASSGSSSNRRSPRTLPQFIKRYPTAARCPSPRRAHSWPAPVPAPRQSSQRAPTAAVVYPWRSRGPWYGRFADRLRFEGDARRHVVGLHVPRRTRHGGVRYRWSVTPPGCERRQVRIDFPITSSRHPRVYVDGPTDSPHRYDDGSLCMWYPRDPLERRWVFDDGLMALLAKSQRISSRSASGASPAVGLATKCLTLTAPRQRDGGSGVVRGRDGDWPVGGDPHRGCRLRMRRAARNMAGCPNNPTRQTTPPLWRSVGRRHGIPRAAAKRHLRLFPSFKSDRQRTQGSHSLILLSTLWERIQLILRPETKESVGSSRPSAMSTYSLPTWVAAAACRSDSSPYLRFG